jgi:hypothetical protein
MIPIDLIQITEDFLAAFKTVDVEVELTDNFYFMPLWTDGDYVQYRSCPIKVNGFQSIAKYENHFKDLEKLYFSQYREWMKDKNKKQMCDTNYDIVRLLNNAIAIFTITKTSDDWRFYNNGLEYLTIDRYSHLGVNITSKGDENKNHDFDYIKDYIYELSYYIEIQFKTLLRVRDYMIGYNEMLFKIDLPKIRESFALKGKIEFNISKATDLKNYLERKTMIIEGNANDFYRLFKNQKLDKKIKWIKGPGHLKHFIQILKSEKIIETKPLYEIAVKCFEFTGDDYNKEISVDKIAHGHIPEETILDSKKLLSIFIQH